MKPVLTAALSRTQSPEFVTLYRFERVALRLLSGVARLLYEELVGLSSFKTGEVSTSYAQLIALLSPDQPVSGPRLAAPTLKQIRSALDELQAADLIARNKALNIDAGKLTLAVESRESARLRNANLGREQGRVTNAKKWLTDNRLAKPVHRNRAGNRAGGAEGSSSSIPQPHETADLSTGQGPQPPQPQDPPGPIALTPPGEKKGPPRGPEPRPAGAGHALQGVPLEDGRARVLALRQELAAKLTAPRTRRPRNTVLKDEAAASGTASAPGEGASEPTGRPRAGDQTPGGPTAPPGREKRP